jgi:fatty aldehyde-generating acyl-ACP reductase
MGKSLRKWLRPALSSLRDGLALLFPKPLVRALSGPADFAFVVHPRDLYDVERRYPAFRKLSRRMREWVLHHHWPVVLDTITVQDAQGRRAKGYLISISLTAAQMLPERILAKKKILQALKLAEKLGCKIAGLGALTASVTKAGTWLLGRTKLALTTGNAYTVAVAYEDIERLIEQFDLKDPLVAIVGCYGNIGEALTKLLGERYRLMLIGRAEDMLFAFIDRVQGRLGPEAVISTDLDDLSQADIVITATNSSSLKLTAEMLKPGAIVYDLAQPPNADHPSFWVTERVLRLDGGYVAVPGLQMRFNMGLPKGVVFACLAETILQALERDFRHHVGRVDLGHVTLTQRWARRAGFRSALAREKEVITSGYFSGSARGDDTSMA